MVTCGFFNSVYGDRKYDADQMSDFYTGIVTQGVFQHVDNGLEVSAGTGLTVSVNTGRAIIQNKWVKNDTPLILELAPAPTTYGRFDIVVLKYDSNSRNVQIIVKTGTPAGTPAVPELVREGGIYEMCLAEIDVEAGATSVTVTDTRSDTALCGWAAVAQATSGEVDAELEAMKTGFDGATYNSPASMVQTSDTKLNTNIGKIAGIPESLYVNGSTPTSTSLNNSGTTYYVSGAYTSWYNNFTNASGLKLYVRGVDRVCLYEGTTFKKVFIPSGNEQVYDISPYATSNALRFTVLSAHNADAWISLSTEGLKEKPMLRPNVEIPFDPAGTGLSATNVVDAIKEISADAIKNIACYGDSLTEGAGSTNASVYSYPARLRTLIREYKSDNSWEMANRGIGGESSERIAARQGFYADRDIVQPFTIPAGTSAVAITKTGTIGAPISGNTTIKNGVNPVCIDGIWGNLSYDNGFYFTRLEAGDQHEVTRPVPLLTYGSVEDPGKILLICMGQNDSDKTSPEYPAKYIRRAKGMIRQANARSFMILGIPTSTASDYGNLEAALEDEFGIRFVNARNYLLNYGLADNSITPTEQDETDIANGVIPSSLRSDSVHLNNSGYYSLALCVFERGKVLGYW